MLMAISKERKDLEMKFKAFLSLKFCVVSFLPLLKHFFLKHWTFIFYFFTTDWSFYFRMDINRISNVALDKVALGEPLEVTLNNGIMI